MTALVLLVVIFLALSGLMAAIDAAVLSVTRPEIDELKSARKWGSRRLAQVKQHITQSVVVIVIVTNTINVLGPILVSREAYEKFGTQGVAVITVVLALGTIVFSEIIPKALGAHYAPLIARMSAPAIQLGRYLMYPLVVFFAWLSKQFTKGSRSFGTEQQIRSLVRMGHEEGHIAAGEGQMIHRVFILNDKTTGEVMTPLDRVKALSDGMTIKQAATEVARTKFSRYPVFGPSMNDVLGIALSREVLLASQDRGGQPVRSVAGPAVIVEARMTVDDVLKMFRDQHSHLAVVQDDGETVGVITLEDVLEELVGEIEDEKDVGG